MTINTSYVVDDGLGLSSLQNLPDIEEVNTDYSDTKERFSNFMEVFAEEAADNLNQEIANAARHEEGFLRRAREQRWKRNDYQNQLESIRENGIRKKEEFEKEFDSLVRHPKVEAVGLRDDSLLIKTTEITMTHPESGERKILGEMEIDLPLKSSNASELQIMNRTNAKQENGGGDSVWQHPHIEDVYPCFGSIEPQMIDLLCNGEFPAVFELLIQYLESFNPEDSLASNWNYWD